MSYAITALAIGTVVSFGAAGLSYYGQQQQAENAQATADYNYQLQQQNAEYNRQIAAQQNRWQQQVYANNAQAQQNNALAIQDQARAVESQSREQARRTREENKSLLAKQRARYAKSGVVNEGTPLSIMAETAGILELQVQDAAYVADMSARSLDRQAAMEIQGADNTLFDAGVAQYEAAAAEAGIAISLNDAKVDRMSGYNAAKGYELASYGSLLSGIGDVASQGGTYYDRSLTRKLYKTTT